MADAMTQKQLVKLEFSLKSFHENIGRMKRETEEEILKILKAGASAYASGMQRHSPPCLGKKNLDPLYYGNGVWYRASEPERRARHGRRQVYDLVALARSDVRFRSYYGRLAREGWRYMILIRRPKKPMKRILCKTEREAAAYAHETYRGITRAAWGLNIPSLSGRLPPAFSDLVRQRPKIKSLTGTGRVTMDTHAHTVRIENSVLSGSESFLTDSDTNASLAAVRSMSDLMERYFKRKRDL